MSWFDKVSYSTTERKVGRKSYAYKGALIVRIGDATVTSADLTVDEIEDFAAHMQATAKKMRLGETAEARRRAKIANGA